MREGCCKFHAMQSSIFCLNYDSPTTRKRQIKTDLALSAKNANCISPATPGGQTD